MVIQCNACQTRFRLAEEKIKPQGSKVRCSKCGEVFIVLPPALPPSEPAIEDFVPPATGAVTGQAPADTSSPDGGDYHDWSDFDLPRNDSVSAPAAAEDDFQDFPATVPTGTAAAGEFREDEIRSAAGSEDDFSFEAPAPDADEFTFGEESTGDEQEVTFEEELGGEDDFALGNEGTDERTESLSPLEFDTLAFDELPSGSGATDADLAAGLGAGASDELIFEENDEPSLAPADPEEDEEAFSWGVPDDATAFPDDFDFGDTSEDSGGADTNDLDFDSPDLAAEEPSPTPVRTKRAAAPATRKPSEPERAAPLTAEPILPVDRRKYARRRRKGGTSLLTWLVALILLGLCAATGYFYWLGEFPDVNGLLNRFMPSAATAPTTSEIKVAEVNGFFVNNTEAGQLFVVQGQAVNGYPESRSAMSVQGKLFNRAGSLLRERSAYCGNSLSESELKSLPLAKLRERSENQFGDSLSNLNVATGKSVPFTIVFNKLPSDLAEFTVEPGDSIPGSKQ